MKIFIAHSNYYDFKNELYLPIRNSKLNQIHDILLPQENNTIEPVTKNLIKNSDLVIAEVSLPSTGQGIELGWANIFNIPIICIYKTGSRFSKSLAKITNNFIEYNSSDDMIKKISDFLIK